MAPTGRLRIVEWDYRGHDDSAPGAAPDRYRVEDHAADLLAVPDGRHTLLMTRGEWIGERILEFLRRRGVVAR